MTKEWFDRFREICITLKRPRRDIEMVQADIAYQLTRIADAMKPAPDVTGLVGIARKLLAAMEKILWVDDGRGHGSGEMNVRYSTFEKLQSALAAYEKGAAK